MKKLMLIAALAAVTNWAFAQKLQKGNLLGLHVMTVTLKSGVTMDQFTAFYISNVIPAYEKQFKGATGYIISGVRGDNKNSLGVIWLFKTEADRNKYFGEDDQPTELGKAATAKVEDVNKELEKLGTVETKYTDWVVR